MGSPLVYGPERFTRTAGIPNQFSRSISTRGFVSPFILHVVNGSSEGSSTITSARVTVDGVELLGPRDFDRSRKSWDIPITLGSTMGLHVELASRPGSFLEISLTGSAPPVVVSTGYLWTCVLTGTGATDCWGWNAYGQLGDGTTIDRLTPAPVLSNLAFTSLAVGNGSVCGLTQTGAAYCWGANTSGQLGDGTTSNRSVPTPVVGGLEFIGLTAGSEHTCGVTRGGAAYCWGRNTYGALGDGTNLGRLTPVAVQGGLTFTALVAKGGYTTCGLTAAGAAYCWGLNNDGQLGDGSQTDHYVPVAVGGGLVFKSLAGGAFHNCGVTLAGAAYCWGTNNSNGYTDLAGNPDQGQLGDGTTINRSSPVAVAGGIAFASLSLGGDFSCGVSVTGAAYCWGNNAVGQLATGTTINSLVPIAATGGISFRSIVSTSYDSCGSTDAGAIFCWGWNSYGQLGDGTTTTRLAPVAMVYR